MASIKDDRGYNQGFEPGKALIIRTKRRSDWMISLMREDNEIDILEIGCGTGEISSNLSKKENFKVLGTDLCLPFINRAQNTYASSNLKFQVLDFRNPQVLGDKKFDYIVGNGILHHLFYDIESSLLTMKMLLKDNGKILFIEPNIYNPYCFLIFKTFKYLRKMANLEPDEMAFSGSFIKKVLRKLEYSGIEIQHKDFLLPNTPDYLINSVIRIGSFFEKIPIIKFMSQSIFISASK